MNISEVKNRTPYLNSQLLTVWESSVKETHLFLSCEEIDTIKIYVPQALTNIPHLIVMKDKYDNLIGFMGIEHKTIDMLFISPEHREFGYGKRLVQYGIDNYSVNNVTVNEQNHKAVGFYKHLGFKIYKRTDLDEQGNPYPLLYMRLQ